MRPSAVEQRSGRFGELFRIRLGDTMLMKLSTTHNFRRIDVASERPRLAARNGTLCTHVSRGWIIGQRLTRPPLTYRGGETERLVRSRPKRRNCQPRPPPLPLAALAS